jgi:hypothetical protein
MEYFATKTITNLSVALRNFISLKIEKNKLQEEISMPHSTLLRAFVKIIRTFSIWPNFIRIEKKSMSRIANSHKVRPKPMAVIKCAYSPVFNKILTIVAEHAIRCWSIITSQTYFDQLFRRYKK